MADDGENGDAIVQSSRALVARLRGQPAADVRRFQGDPKLAGIGGRSGNWPWVATAASEDLDWAAEALGGERVTGLGNPEFGAIGYSAYAITGKLRLLQLARQRGHPVEVELASNLRATFALSALAAGAAAPGTLLLRLHDGQKSMTGNSRWRSGLTVCLPAPRQNFDFLNDLLSGLVAWAIQSNPSWRRKYDDTDPTAADLWPIEVVERIMGRPYGGFTDATAWGLTEPLRAAFNARDAAGWRPLIEAVDTWRTAAEIRIVRTEGGVGAGVEGHGMSTFKPTALVKSISASGQAEITMPARWSKGASSQGECAIGAEGWKTTADGVSLDHPFPAGAFLYKLAIGPSGPLRVLDAPSPWPTTQVTNSAPAVVTGPPASSQGSDLANRVAALGVSRKEIPLRDRAVAFLRAGLFSAADLAQAATIVSSLGINPASPDGKAQAALTNDIRHFAGTRS